MELIKDKVCIVTGAAAGIGAGVAKLFAQGGAHVFLTDLDGHVKKVAATLHGTAMPWRRLLRMRSSGLDASTF
jgi:NAD(P)-dependent dehydrogenase (short-subunit alcohol dehydrogenase family)